MDNYYFKVRDAYGNNEVVVKLHITNEVMVLKMLEDIGILSFEELEIDNMIYNVNDYS